MRRREFITLIGGAAAWPVGALAQQATKMPRIGILAPGRADTSDASLPALTAFVAEMRELGYVEGRNVQLQRKFADGDMNRLHALAIEFVEDQVTVIVANSTPADYATSYLIETAMDSARADQWPALDPRFDTKR